MQFLFICLFIFLTHTSLTNLCFAEQTEITPKISKPNKLIRLYKGTQNYFSGLTTSKDTVSSPTNMGYTEQKLSDNLKDLLSNTYQNTHPLLNLQLSNELNDFAYNLIYNPNSVIPNAQTLDAFNLALEKYQKDTIETWQQLLTNPSLLPKGLPSSFTYSYDRNIASKTANQPMEVIATEVGMAEINKWLLRLTPVMQLRKNYEKRNTPSRTFIKNIKNFGNTLKNTPINYFKYTKKRAISFEELERIFFQSNLSLFAVRNALKRFCLIPENQTKIKEFVDLSIDVLSKSKLNILYKACPQIFFDKESPETRMKRRYFLYTKTRSAVEIFIKGLIRFGLKVMIRNFVASQIPILPIANAIIGPSSMEAAKQIANLVKFYSKRVLLGMYALSFLKQGNKFQDIPFAKLLFVDKNTPDTTMKGFKWTDYFRYWNRFIYANYTTKSADGMRRFISLPDMPFEKRISLETTIVTLLRNYHEAKDLWRVKNFLSTLCSVYGPLINQIIEDINTISLRKEANNLIDQSYICPISQPNVMPTPSYLTVLNKEGNHG